MNQNVKYLIAGTAVILAALIAGNAWKYRYKNAKTITVTGLSEKEFTSDQIVWNGSYSRSNTDLKTAYNALKEDEKTVRTYLTTKGVADTSIVISSVDVQKNFTERYDDNGRSTGSVFSGYTLTQKVTVDSKDIPKIEKLSREITELLEQGIELNSSSPSYYYQKLNELKIDLLAKAAADAKERAKTIAKNSGADLSALVKANMGIFQITGKNADEDYSYGGAFNTSSKDKKATITVKVEYRIN
jgi:uncharacterized protein